MNFPENVAYYIAQIVSSISVTECETAMTCINSNVIVDKNLQQSAKSV